MLRGQKEVAVKDMVKLISEAKAGVIAGFQGLTAQEMSELRRRLGQARVEFQVFKNRLAIRAMGITNRTGLKQHLLGPSALAVGTDDPLAPARILKKFGADHENLKIRAGWLDDKILEAADVAHLADLPPRDVLLGQLGGAMKAPIVGLVGVLSGTIRKFLLVLDAITKVKGGK